MKITMIVYCYSTVAIYLSKLKRKIYKNSYTKPILIFVLFQNKISEKVMQLELVDG